MSVMLVLRNQICSIKNLLKTSKHLQTKHRSHGLVKLMSTVANTDEVTAKHVQFIEFHGIWPEKEQEDFIKHMCIIPDFITTEEETKLFEEIEPYMKRLRYEFDHWDDAIHGFRETERRNWYPHNREVIERVRSTAFDGEIMQYVHVLDLDEKGVIKPHVDSTRYCGTTISGMSLLSDSVMRLVRIDEKKYQQDNDNDTIDSDQKDSYRSQPITKLEATLRDIILLMKFSHMRIHSLKATQF